MRKTHATVIGIVTALLLAQTGQADENQSKSRFTGNILPVFYVTDVMRSVEFYRDVLGFEFKHFYDYDKNQQVKTWESDEPPIWALMSAGGFDFGLHLGKSEYELRVGGVVHYFEVTDVKAHYEMVKKRNNLEMSELIEKPWMTMFWVHDPDGHKLFIQTPPEGEE
jgi:catechol 2,3-dioxygenase-like lactoylglutathione lyase family enzyme